MTKQKRKISKGSGTRYAPSRPRPEITRRVRPPAASSAEKSLRKQLMKFVAQEPFHKDFDRAMEQYFERKFSPDQPKEMDEFQMPNFIEWLLNDYVRLDGRRFVDQFNEEVAPRLPMAQAAILADWLVSDRQLLLEVQNVEPGVGVTAQDLLSGETLMVKDISSSYTLVRWEVLLVRTLLTEGRMCFSGTVQPLRPQDKEELLGAAQSLWAEYQAQHPQAKLGDFYRDHSLDLLKVHRRIVEEISKPPIVLTAEGHPIVLARARYTIRGDPRAVVKALDKTVEFDYAGKSEEHKGALHYNWVQRGRSHIPEATEKPRNAVMLQTQNLAPGRENALNLGDLDVGSKLMELECMSRERLEVGKALLAEVLGKLVQHSGDHFEDFEPFQEEATESPRKRRRTSKEEIPPHIAEQIQKEYVERHMTNWFDESIPMLGNISPRQAAQTPEGRARLEELFKEMEYMEDKRARDGEPVFFSVARVRRELGLEK